MKNHIKNKHKNVLFKKGTQGMALLSLAVIWYQKNIKSLYNNSASRAVVLSYFKSFLPIRHRASSASRARVLSLLGVFIVGTGILMSILVSSFDRASAATSNQLNFQGRLLTNTGALVPDGVYNMQFDLYYVATSGSSQWTEDRLVTNTQGVTIRNGYFSVYLGEYDAFPALDWSQDLYLGMTIRGTNNCAWGSCTPADSEMTPRFKMTSVPYAFKASNVASSGTNASSTNSDGVSVTTGNASGATSNSGAITIDTGTATGTAGAISIGTANTSAITIGRSGIATTLQSTLTATGLATLNGGLTIEAGDNFTFNGDVFTDFTGGGLSNVSGLLTVDSTSSSGFFQQGGNTFGATAVLGTNDSNSLVFRTNSTTQATLAVGGALTLQNSSNSTSALRVNNASGTAILNVDSTNSRVGIGTATPSYKLEVTESATARTTDARVVSISESGSFDTTSGDLDSYGLYITNSATISSGSNVINKYGVYASATGGPSTIGVYGTGVIGVEGIGVGGFSGFNVGLSGTGSLYGVTGTSTAVTGGVFTGVTGGIDVITNNTSSTAGTIHGGNIDVTDTGVVTTGTDTTYGLEVDVTRTGATGGTINTIGADINVTGDTGGTSTVTGLNVNVSGADTNYAAIFQGGNVGVGTATPGSVLNVIGSQPGSVAGSGTNATQVLGVVGGQGGDTSGTTGQTAGTGGVIVLTAGQGGDAPSGSTNGNGGSITIQGGSPGSGGGSAGSYGDVALQSSGGQVSVGGLTACGNVYTTASNYLACGNAIETSVGAIRVFGHSYSTSFGASSNGAWVERLSSMLQARNINRGQNGAILGYDNGVTSGKGGYATVLQKTVRSRTSAPYLTNDGVGIYDYGLNDASIYSDPSFLGQTPFQEALRTIISRDRAAAVFEETDASVSLVGSWSPTSDTNVGSGTGYTSTTVNGDTFTITVPSDFPGGTVAVGLTAGTGSNGGIISYTVDAVGSGSTDTRNIALSGRKTGMVHRFTGLSAGAHTIVGTTSSITGSVIFDYWQIEASVSPLTLVHNVARLPSYTAYTTFGIPLTDTQINTMNSNIESVVSEFDSSVIIVDIDTALNQDAANFYAADSAHPNDLGHAIIANATLKALREAPITVEEFAKTIGASSTLIVRSFNNNTEALNVVDSDNTSVFLVDTTNGRVGINNSAPTEALDVVGNAVLSGNLVVSGTGASSVGGTFDVASSLTVGNGTATGLPAATDIVHTFSTADNCALSCYGLVTYVTADNPTNPNALIGNNIALATSNTSFTLTSAIGLNIAGTTKGAASTITLNTGIYVGAQSTGVTNVGINIQEATGTNQTNLLIGAAYQTGSYSIYNGSSDNNYFAGNLGIGDSSPAAPLTVGNGDLFQVSSAGVVTYVNGSTDSATQVCKNSSGQLAACNTTGTGAAFQQGGNTFGATAVLGTNDSNSLVFRTNSTTQATLAVGGALTLQNSSNSTSALRVNNASGTAILNVDSTNSRVGIGTATPDTPLEVVGSTRITHSADTVLTGSIDPTASVSVTGVGTLFLSELVVGDAIQVNGEVRTVTAIASNTSLTVDTLFSNTANDTSPDRLGSSLTVVNNTGALTFSSNSDKLYVGKTSTSTTAAREVGQFINVIDTGDISSGSDVTSGLRVSVERTGATAGTFSTYGGEFAAEGDTAGTSTAIGLSASGTQADISYGVLGTGYASGGSALTETTGVYGSVQGFLFGTTVTEANALKASLTGDGFVGGTITDYAGLRVETGVLGLTTVGTSYGIYVENQTVGTTNYGIYVADAADYSLYLASTDGDAASGITFGADTNLYRSAANTLFTNDSLTVDTNLTVNGNTTLGNAASDTISFTGRVNTNLLPSADDTYDLGSSTNRWQDLYLGPASLHVGTDGDEGILSYNTTDNQFEFDQNLHVVGNASLTGDLTVQGGDLLTNQTTFNLLNTTATTLNIGGAATTLEVGAATGTTSINNNLTVDGNIVVGAATNNNWATGAGDLYVQDEIELDGNLTIAEDKSINWDANGAGATSYITGTSGDILQVGNDAATGILQLQSSQLTWQNSSDSYAANFEIDSDGSAFFKSKTNATDSFQVRNAAGTAILNVDSINSRVGIGTSSPAASLHVQGAEVAGTGTISTPGFSPSATGTGTSFTTEVVVGDTFLAGGQVHTVTAVNSDTSLTLSGCFCAGLPAGTSFTIRKPIIRLSDATGTTVFSIDGRGGYSLGASDRLLGLDTNVAAGVGYGLTVNAGAASDGNGGALILNGGSAGGTDKNGGDTYIAGGSATGTGTAGNVRLAWNGLAHVGTVTVGNATGTATLNVGSSVSGQNLLKVTDQTATATDVLLIADGGATTFRNQTNSTSGLAVQSAAGTSIFNVDTTNSRVGIGDSTPDAKLDVEVASSTVAIFNRLTNDGHIIDFQQDGTVEGFISVAGTTLTYSTFTGSHNAYNPTESFTTGHLVRANGDNGTYHNKPDGEIVYGITTTTTENDPEVLGLFLDKGESTKPLSYDNPYLIAAAGNGSVWVVDEGQDISVGDYLISSSTAGHARKDSRSASVSYVVGRAVEPVNWSSVTATINGKKHRKVSIYFEFFSRDNVTSTLQAENINIQQSANIGGNITLAGSASVGGSLNVSGETTTTNLMVQGTTTTVNLEVTGNTLITGNLSVAGDTTLANLTVSGKIISQGSVPTVSNGAVLGINDTSAVTGNDIAGSISINTSPLTTASSGELASVTFNNNYTTAPRISITAKNSASASIRVYVETTGTGFKLHTLDAPTPGTIYEFDYILIQ